MQVDSDSRDAITETAQNIRPPGPVRQASGGRSLTSIKLTHSGPIRDGAPPTPGTPGLYNSAATASAERLLPPSRSRAHRFRDEDPLSVLGSPELSGHSSRRTSWSSEAGSRDSRMIYSPNPFEDSRAPSRAGSDDENVNTQTVAEKYNILPSAGLLLFPEDVEKDDYLHNPDPNGKEPRDCDIFTKRGLINIGGLLLIIFGFLALFVGYPVLYVMSFPLFALTGCVYVSSSVRLTIPLQKPCPKAKWFKGSVQRQLQLSRCRNH